MALEGLSKKNQNVLMALLVIAAGVGLVAYIGIYLSSLLYPNFEDTAPKASTIGIKESDQQIVQDLNKVNTYLLQPTVSPNEVGRKNPFAPI
ncbi:MAG: hypothetical protein WCP97_01505 [bacterium]